MNDTCGCCEGIEVLSPKQIVNRPGLNALAYRVGTHATFLETMKARLSNYYLDIPQERVNEPGQPRIERIYPLKGLTTRTSDDPSIALLDAWATVGGVLTFYQERIANEGYLRTATERRSILELARLAGYALRPGVASTVYLAYTIDNNFKNEVIIPTGARTQSVPGPGELPQSFETSEPLNARAEWNVLKPRLTQPQTRDSIEIGDANGNVRLYVKGIDANLKPNDVVLITVDDQACKIYHVAEAKADPANDRTLVIFQEETTQAQAALTRKGIDVSNVISIIENYITSKPRTGRSTARTDMVKRVIELLQALIGLLRAPDLTAETAEQAIHQTVARISEELDVVVREQYTKLSPWLSEMVEKLNEAAQGILTAANEESLAFVDSSTLTAGSSEVRGFEPPSDPLKSVMSYLTKPASVPPRNAFSLDRSLSRTFTKHGDISLKLASTFDINLTQSLPKALANVKVTPDSNMHAYVFRAVARPFGHNAPPRPIRFDSARRITIYGEWRIDDPLNEPRPVAAFKAAPLSGSAPLPVQFTNLSTGEIVSYIWDFGDGTSSRRQNPLHTFRTPDLYTISLTVSGPLGIDTIRALINVTGIVPLNMTLSEEVTQLSASLHRHHTPNVMFLDTEYNIRADSWIVIERKGATTKSINLRATGGNATQQSLAAYGMSGKATRLYLGTDKNWLSDQDDFNAVRQTVVYVQSEELPLAEEPIEVSMCGGEIELDGLDSGLQSGRWLIVSGERDDIVDENGNTVIGVQAAELVMIDEVTQQTKTVPHATGSEESQGQPLRGDRTHTFIKLARKLEYCYLRDKIKIFGNVVKATHGETRNEVLGSGDASQALHSFTLNQSPLTYVPASNPRGVESTLHVRVSDVEWHEAENLLTPNEERKFITRTSDDEKTTVLFGTSPPTGTENIKAVYRTGIGKAGNVRAEQISMLATRPLGVKEVINPLRASGGAPRESRDQARRNAPLAVLALDRLVSTQDYADLAHTFAGIGKASASRLSDGRRQVVYVTIAGADDIPIDKSSDLYSNLVKALREFGEPYQPIQVEMRELMLIVISANVRILPNFLWESVVTKIRTRLLDTFSFDRRVLGQDVLLSEVISTIQSVEGVAFVDVNTLRGIPEKTEDENNPRNRRLLTPIEIAQKITDPLLDEQEDGITEPLSRLSVNLAGHENNAIRPAQLAFLSPEIEATLILNEVMP